MGTVDRRFLVSHEEDVKKKGTEGKKNTSERRSELCGRTPPHYRCDQSFLRSPCRLTLQSRGEVRLAPPGPRHHQSVPPMVHTEAVGYSMPLLRIGIWRRWRSL